MKDLSCTVNPCLKILLCLTWIDLKSNAKNSQDWLLHSPLDVEEVAWKSIASAKPYTLANYSEVLFLILTTYLH